MSNESKTIIQKNIKYKWQAISTANCPLKLAALNIAFNLIYTVSGKKGTDSTLDITLTKSNI